MTDWYYCYCYCLVEMEELNYSGFWKVCTLASCWVALEVTGICQGQKAPVSENSKAAEGVRGRQFSIALPVAADGPLHSATAWRCRRMWNWQSWPRGMWLETQCSTWQWKGWMCLSSRVHLALVWSDHLLWVLLMCFQKTPYLFFTRSNEAHKWRRLTH